MNKVAVVGSLNMDIITEVSQLPQSNQTVSAKSVEYKAGGKGINQAAAASALGASVILIGNVGEDAFGQQLIGEINKIPSLDSSRVINNNGSSTGINSVIKDNNQSYKAYLAGANNKTDGKIVKENDFILKEADVVITQFGIPESGVEETLKAANFGKAVSIVNPSPYCSFPKEWLKAISVIVPTESEFIDMAEDFNIAPGTLEKRALEWQKQNPETKLIILLSDNGVEYVEGENIVRLRPEKIKVVDNLNSEDIFTGALAALLSQNLPFEEAIYKASVAAGLSTAHKGTLGSAPKMEDINLFISNSEEDANK